YDLSGTKYVPGHEYMIELYANDMAGNYQATARAGGTGCPVAANADALCQTGVVGNPKYVRYFAVDNSIPTILITTPTVTVPNNIGLASALATISGTTSDLCFGVDH